MPKPLVTARFCSAWIFGLLFVASAGVAQAQRQVVGIVVDSVSGKPIPGAVVMVRDSSGQIRQELLTNAAGRFTVRVDPEWRELRVLRLGFKPVQLEGNAWRQEKLLEIHMAPFAFVLESVKTTTASICHGDPAGANAAGSLWEQARASLLATVISRKSLPATATVVEYHRSFDAGFQRILGQWVHRSVGLEQRPFGSVASARELTETGFVVDHADSRQYIVPNADVLLSPEFTAAHCFGVVAGADEHAGEVGLSFWPASNANTRHADVRGTIWFGISGPQLQSIVFHYTGIEASAEKAGAGGRLRYHSMSSGIAALTEWELAGPVVVRRLMPRAGQLAWAGDSVTQVDSIGAVLAHATWPDGSQYQAALATVRGRVERGSDSKATAALGIRVWIDSTYYAAETDSMGEFRIPDVLPGRYRIHYEDPNLVEFTGREEHVDLDVKVGDNVLKSPTFPTLSEIEERTCGASRVTANSALLYGALTMFERPPTRTIDLSVTWPGIGSSTFGHHLVHPESHGRFRICGVPRGRVVSISAQLDSIVVLDTIVTSPHQAVGVLRLLLRPPRRE